MKQIFTFLAVLIIATAPAQEIKRYEWDAKPVFQEIPEQYKNEQAVVLFDKRWVHTRVGAYAFATFNMNHFAVKINTADAINKYNKVRAEDNGYIRTVRDFHARIVKPTGEIKVLKPESIVETEVDKVKSIVFEGVEPGDILEYYFILKENPTSSSVEIFQKEIPVLNAEFSITKEGVEFNVSKHELFTTSREGSKMIYKASDLKPYKEEKNSKNVKNIVKLIYNIHVSGQDNAQWTSFMPMVYKKPSFNYFKKNQAKAFITNLHLENLSTDEKVKKLDLYVKENFDFVWKGEKAKKITNLSAGKQKLAASDVFDLYGFVLRELKIPYEVVICVDRFYGDTDSFRHVNPLPHEVMYFIPETKKFITPYEKYLSYGYPMYELQTSKGVSYNPTAKGTNVFGIDFPVAPADYTLSQTVNTVTLSEDFSSATIDKKFSTTGYLGQIDRYYSKQIKENEEEKDVIDYLKNRTIKDVDVKILDYSYENKDFKDNYTNTPFVINLKLETKETITENAGNLLLVNLGKVIGKQNNLYQENERFSDVDLLYNKSYSHKIVLNIPEGYEVESYKDLVIDRTMDYDSNKTCWFKSNVKVEGNQLIVEVDEKYQSLTYPKESYQEYRKVVNAAADFAKAALILKRKQ